MDLSEVVSRISSFRVQVTSAGGSPMILASNLTISPAETVMSFNLFLSILGGWNLALASLNLEGWLGSLRPALFSAYTRNWYSSPSYKLVAVALHLMLSCLKSKHVYYYFFPISNWHRSVSYPASAVAEFETLCCQLRIVKKQKD